ncbi:MAG TPA: tyrosine-type recombinase/integrase [Nannocystis sp.]
MARRRKSRIYTRNQGGTVRYYADFRDFADVGGRQEALIPPGERRATDDPDIAAALAAKRLQELQAKRQNRALLGITKEATFGAYAAYHLVEKKKAGRVTDYWLAQQQSYLDRAIRFFTVYVALKAAHRDDQRALAETRAVLAEAPDRPLIPEGFQDVGLTQIGVEEVQRWMGELARTPSGRHGGSGRVRPLSAGTIRHHLNAVSNLYARAQSEGYVPPGYNPVAALLDKPVARAEEAAWLEVHEAALLLEAARHYRPKRADLAIPPRRLHALIATFLLTGGRETEVYGLEVDDISFDRRTVAFRTNQWRRLKTRTSHRVVPLWPQLEEILREYVFGADAPPGRLLFPAFGRNGEQLITDIRKPLDAIASLVGWKPGDIRTKMFRHTYCAARLQTLDHGAPVALYTVQREMGHGGDALVKRVYGHLGEVRHRSSVVEYRVDQHAHLPEIRDRLALLRTHQ